MAHAVIKIWLFLLFDFSVTEAALTPEIVFDVLSRRMDFVIQETNALKSELEEVKSDFKSELREVVGKIENVEGSMSAFSRNEENIDDEMEESDVNENMKRQLVALRKTLSTEKYHLRKMMRNFENKFNEFETEIKSQMAQIQDSEENSVDGMVQALAQHKVETNTSLMLISSRLETISNGTDTQIEDMKQDIEENNKDSLEKINEIKQEILDRTRTDLKSAKDGFTGLIYTEVGMVKSKVASIEGKQEKLDDKFEVQIKQLSNRISEEEARKVAFSARIDAKRDSYGQREIIVFDHVIYSYGGGYSSSTGIFTAPKSGTYIFTFNVEATSNGKAHVFLRIRGFIKTRTIAPKGTDSNAGNVAIEYVSKGDEVWLETSRFEQRYYIWPYRSNFNGILID